MIHKFLSLLLNEQLQSELMQKSRSVQNVIRGNMADGRVIN